MARKRRPAGSSQAHGGSGRAAQRANVRSHCTSEDKAGQPKHGVVRNGTWYKRVRKSEHLMRLPKPSWSVDKEDLLRALALGATYLEVQEVEERRTYRTTLDKYVIHGVRFDYGCGVQVRLPLGYWQVFGDADKPTTGTGQLELAL